jgi:hypothetical protein
MGEFDRAASIIPINPPMEVPIQWMKGERCGAGRRMSFAKGPARFSCATRACSQKDESERIPLRGER